MEIRVTKDGPYLVSDNLPLAKVTIGANEDGESVRYDWDKPFKQQRQYALCRCGHSASKPYLCRCGASKNKPFCDGTHAAIKFRG